MTSVRLGHFKFIAEQITGRFRSTSTVALDFEA